jgi:translation initiation factor 1
MSLFAGTKFYQEPKCERCGLLEAECQCPPLKPEQKLVPPEKQTARIRKEKRRKGKTVTVIRGLMAEDNDFPKLLKLLKNKLGSGGSIQEDSIEIQGDCRDQVAKHLSSIGYKTKIDS